MSRREPGGDMVDAYLDRPDQPEEQTAVTDNDTTAEQAEPAYHWGGPEGKNLVTNPKGITPIPADVDDSDIWPTTEQRSGGWFSKGKAIIRRHRPEPAALEAATRRAREVNSYDIEEIARTPSHDEIQQRIETARGRRDDWVALETREHQDEIQRADAQRQHLAGLQEKIRQAENDRADAYRQQQQLLDSTTQLKLLAWAEKYLPWLSAVPALAAAAVGAVNVGNELSRINPGAWLVGWMVEPLFTIPLLLILLAQVLGAVPKPDLSKGVRAGIAANQYVAFEIGLTVAAIVLNVVPHLLPTGHWAGSLVWLAVPAGLGFSCYLVPKIVSDARRSLAEWDAGDDAGTDPIKAQTVRVDTTGTTGSRLVPQQVTAGSGRSTGPGSGEVERDLWQELLDHVRNHTIDPGTDGSGTDPIDPTNGASVTRVMGVRKATALELARRYKNETGPQG